MNWRSAHGGCEVIVRLTLVVVDRYGITLGVINSGEQRGGSVAILRSIIEMTEVHRNFE